MVSSDTATGSLDCHAVHYDKAFVSDERTYYNLGVGRTNLDEPNRIKGIVPLMKLFQEASDQAYLEDYVDLKAAQAASKELEDEMVTNLGDIYREGYWQKADYVDGDEDKLYYDGLENLEKISKPETKYDIQYLDLYDTNTKEFQYAVDDITNEVYWPDI